MKIKTGKNIPPSKSNPPLHLCSKDISEILAKESDYRFKYFTSEVSPGFVYKINKSECHP